MRLDRTRMDPTSEQFFELKYQQSTDPWDFAASPYESGRYDAILRLLNGRRYLRAFEPGCSIGVFTARLAYYCDQLEAIDISPTAAMRARTRCQALPNVSVRCGALPTAIPDGAFDLIVLSEIGYYFGERQLASLADALVQKLSSGGTLLAAHWLGTSEDHLLSGDAVHQVLASRNGLTRQHYEQHASFRLDLWTRSGTHQ